MRSPHFNEYGKTCANPPVDLRRVGRLTLVDSSMVFVEEVDLICCELNSNVGDRPLPSETSALLVYNLGTSFVE